MKDRILGAIGVIMLLAVSAGFGYILAYMALAGLAGTLEEPVTP
jgi:hypothetical protein